MTAMKGQRIMAALGCAGIMAFFGGLTWLEGLIVVTWLFGVLGVASATVCLFAPESVLKRVRLLW